ncbi:MAG TPA: type IV toxin-antitoxin system AbiEi family antitoxin domain-containing protein, partial [Geobacteraceae bacterium]|nr:type IV toxin-antitoxin system AbiEi family antitoxin domain-containing protein [Geobacteraceae bacterium]
MQERQSTKKRVITIVKRRGVLRPRDLDTHNISRTVLQRLYHDGTLERVGHGLYRLATAVATE